MFSCLLDIFCVYHVWVLPCAICELAKQSIFSLVILNVFTRHFLSGCVCLWYVWQLVYFCCVNFVFLFFELCSCRVCISSESGSQVVKSASKNGKPGGHRERWGNNMWQSSWRRWSLSWDPNTGSSGRKYVGERVFPTEKMASVKALRQEQVWKGHGGLRKVIGVDKE